MALPEIHLSQGLQEFCAYEPIGRVPQGKQVNDQLKAQFTKRATGQGHDAVLI